MDPTRNSQGPSLLSSYLDHITESNLAVINSLTADAIIGIGTAGTTFNLTGGVLTGINDPVDGSDALVKGYADTYVLANPVLPFQGPVNSIQVTSNGNFANVGISWTGTALISPGFSDTISSWINGSISGLFDPVTSSQIATKNYALSTKDLTPIYITSTENVTYTVEQCTNTIIFRDTLGASVEDLLPLGTEFERTQFSIKNTTTTSSGGSTSGASGSGSLKIVPNLGTTLLSTLNSNYISIANGIQVNLLIIPNSDNSVDILVLSFLSNFITGANAVETNNLIVSSSLFSRTSAITYVNDFNVEYDVNAILSGYISRGPGLTANRTDTLIDKTTFSASIPFYSSSETDPIGTLFQVKNEDAVYSIIINLSANNWTPDPDLSSTITIGPGFTCSFGISFIGSVGTIYILGIF